MSHIARQTPKDFTVRTETDVLGLSLGRKGALVDAGNATDLGRPASARFHWISKDELRIGRNPDAGRGALTWSVRCRRASARHARIVRRGFGFEILDDGSTNGTVVDGHLVETSALRDGAILFFGGQVAVFRMLDQDDRLALEEEDAAPFGPVRTASPRMARALKKLRRLAASDVEICLVGETGAGKEVYAHAVHRVSRRKGPFLPINCAAVPSDLVESELFGYSRGAHSQAGRAKRGLIEEAEGGTLFLDEIGDMPRTAQAKLLRFIQTKEFVPLGATRARQLDVRIVAATNQVTARVDGQGGPGMREDLLGRMGAEPIVLPPLRDRPEDLGALSAHFLARLPAPIEIEPSAFTALFLHHWPRNVRELEKSLQEAALLSDGGRIRVANLPQSVIASADEAHETPSRPTVVAKIEEVRRSPRPMPAPEELDAELKKHDGNVAKVARALDRQWAVVWRALARHGIDPDNYKK
jgi:transcriptional regulator with PAS, ATPase and Fis domain